MSKQYRKWCFILTKGLYLRCLGLVDPVGVHLGSDTRALFRCDSRKEYTVKVLTYRLQGYEIVGDFNSEIAHLAMGNNQV